MKFRIKKYELIILISISVLSPAESTPPENIIAKVMFQGNRSFSRQALLAVIQTRPKQKINEATLLQDLRALESFYKNQGFFEVKVEKGVKTVRGSKTVTFYINEGPRTKIYKINIEGNRDFPAGRLLQILPFGLGTSWRANLIESGVQALTRFYLNSGYPFVVIDGTFKREDTLAFIHFVIDEGPLCYLKEIRVRGNRMVRTSTIIRTTELRPGEKFSRRRLEEAQRRLYATKLFSRVLFVILRVQAPAVVDSVDVRFDVVEQAQSGVAFGLGFETPPTRALFSLEWEHNNVANRGHWLLWEASFSPDLTGNYRASLDLTWKVPFLWRTKIDFSIHPYCYWERIAPGLQREYGVETGMSRDLLPQLRVSLFNRLRLVADTAQGVTNSILLSGVYDCRDNFFDPRRGWYIQPGIELAGGPFLGSNDFVRGSSDLRLYQALGKWLVFAGRITAGRVVPYGRSQSVPYYEEFYLGGRNNLRGYPDRALGPDTASGGRYGPVVVNGSVELRGPYLFRWVGLVGFFDAGQVAGQNDLWLRGIEMGAGAGIRVRTPIGPVRLDWGKRLKSPPKGDWGRLYFGVLHTF